MPKWPPLFEQITKISGYIIKNIRLRIIEILQYSLFKTNAHLNRIFLTGTSY